MTTSVSTGSERRAATDKQVAFLITLVNERGAEAKTYVDTQMATFKGVKHPRDLSRGAISQVIGVVKDMPRAVSAPEGAGRADAVRAPKPEAGRYAVEYKGVLRFYSVSAARSGRYRGMLFTRRYRSDAEDRVGAVEREAVHTLIAADPQAARKRFADETSHCWRCGRRLTDTEQEGRVLGLGPDCYEIFMGGAAA